MTDFVLIHGAFHGGWCWDEVAKQLRQAGHRVYAPSLSGCSERLHEPHGVISLKTHIDEVTKHILEADLRECVLVGHSLGGMVVTGIAERVRDRVSHLIYLDAFVPQSGEAARDFIPQPTYNAALQAVHVNGCGVSLPVIFPSTKFVRFEGIEQAAFMARLTPQPFLTFLEPIYLDKPPVHRRSFVYCSGVPFGLFDRFADAARANTAWSFYDMPTAHDAMIEDPQTLTSILQA